MAWYNPLTWFAKKKAQTKEPLPPHTAHHMDRKAEMEACPTEGAVMLLGDSITNGWVNYRHLFPCEFVNRAIAGDTSYGLMDILPLIVKERPHKLFLMVGTNNLGWNTPECVNRLFKDIEDIIGKFHSVGTRVYLQSILPVDPDIMKAKMPELAPGVSMSNAAALIGARNAQNITLINAGLTLFANPLTEYINLWDHFATDKGTIIPELTCDGLHLSEMGYKVWGEILTPYVRG